MRLSISEIIKKTATLPDDQSKQDWLSKNQSPALKTVMKYTYDKENVTFLIPDTPPPWKKNSYVGVEGMLYNEARRLKIFVKGGGYDNLNQTKREHLFISLLEDIDNNDAEMLCQMIKQEPFPGIPAEVVRKAFPDVFPVDLKTK